LPVGLFAPPNSWVTAPLRFTPTADADGAPHVQLADEAVRIGPGPVGESYLLPERILEAAARVALNRFIPVMVFSVKMPPLPKAVEAAGLVFIGPQC